MSVCSVEVLEIWDHTSFRGIFDVVALSCKTGLLKSNLEFYKTTLSQLKSVPALTIYVGDSPKELEKASEAGMVSIRMRSEKQKEWDGLEVNEPKDVITAIFKLNQSNIKPLNH